LNIHLEMNKLDTLLQHSIPHQKMAKFKICFGCLIELPKIHTNFQFTIIFKHYYYGW
jgi:hypothetical protein